MKRTLLILVLLAAAAAGGVAWWLNRPKPSATQLTLYGNVDLRQVELAFNNNERIAAVLVQEGDRVKKGQLLARLDTGRLEPQVAQADAQVAAQRNIVERLHNGNRPEEIAQAKANVESAQADAANARRQYERFKSLAPKGAASQQDFENAKAAARRRPSQAGRGPESVGIATRRPAKRRDRGERGPAASQSKPRRHISAKCCGTPSPQRRWTP